MNAGVIKSAGRALEVFEYFADRKAPATISDVSRALGYPQSSTSALMKSLTTLGYLDYDAQRRRYTPTVRIALLGSWVQEQLFGDADVIGLMEAIHRETKETIVLGLQNGIYCQYVRIIEADRAIRFHLKVGTLRPLTRAAVGKVLLSQKSNTEIAKIVRRLNAEADDPAHRVKESDFLKETEKIRRLGYAQTAGSMVPGAGVIAKLIPSTTLQPPLSIGVGAPVERLKEDGASIIGILEKFLTPLTATLTTKPVSEPNKEKLDHV
jgi:DNA-binding IclR family transcriptional regulator